MEVNTIKEQQINEQIRDREIRLIGDNGEQLGIMSSREAQALANEKNLDLVKISPNANPPVCKIMDFGKYRYEAAKKEKESRKKQKVVVLKEIRLRPAIDVNDLKTKAKNAVKFLEAGDKVKVAVRFRGRELGHKDIGYQVIKTFVEMVGDAGVPEKDPKFEGNSLVLIMEPKKKI